MDKILEFSKRIIKDKANKELNAIDMTCGRGNDTLFLSTLFKKVYSFDVQEEAINSSRELTKDKQNIDYILDNHKNVDKYVKDKVGLVIYNLGYLPKGDKNITTCAFDVIESLEKVTNLLESKGVIIITVYPGHPAGALESVEIDKYLRKYNQKMFEVLKYEFINQINNPPYLYVIEKL